jgi:hypothetical protein
LIAEPEKEGDSRREPEENERPNGAAEDFHRQDFKSDEGGKSRIRRARPPRNLGKSRPRLLTKWY